MRGGPLFKHPGHSADDGCDEKERVMGARDTSPNDGPSASTADPRAEATMPPVTTDQSSRPSTRLIALGAASFLLVGALSFLSSSSTTPGDSISTVAGSPSTRESASEDGADGPSSFTSSTLDTGWTHYESAAEGFSLELPPGWGPFAAGDQFGPELRFTASEAPPFASFGASLYVMRSPTNGYSDPTEYFEIWRNYLASSPHADPYVGMTTTKMRDGQGYVLTTKYNSKSGEHTETAYGVLQGDTAYRLVFVVSGLYLDENEDVFHDIAMTFDITA
jgi:hypothetical protein